ncbi:MAG: ComF family protein [Anaerolineae bacterium]
MRRANSVIQAMWSTTLDLLYPPRCAGCGQVDTVLCPNCRAVLDAISSPLVLPALSPLRGLMATGTHAGLLRRVVKSFKFTSDRSTAHALAAPLAERLLWALQHSRWTVDLIVPLPLHKDRQRDRGYNQSQILALALAQRTGISASDRAVIRWRPTRSQVGLSRAERRKNVQDAFRADPTLVSGRVILLVDDVCTTGATLTACAASLIDAGAEAVYGLTVTAAGAAPEKMSPLS